MADWLVGMFPPGRCRGAVVGVLVVAMDGPFAVFVSPNPVLRARCIAGIASVPFGYR